MELLGQRIWTLVNFYSYFQISPQISLLKSVYENSIACQYYMLSNVLSFSILKVNISFSDYLKIVFIMNKFEHFFQMSWFIETLHILVKLALVWDISSNIASQFIISFNLYYVDFCKVGIFLFLYSRICQSFIFFGFCHIEKTSPILKL